MTKAELEEAFAQAVRERDEALIAHHEALAARESIAAELVTSREQLAAAMTRLSEHEATVAELDRVREQLAALKAETPAPAPLSPSVAAREGLAAVLDWYGVGDAHVEAGRLLKRLADTAPDMASEPVARALQVFAAG